MMIEPFVAVIERVPSISTVSLIVCDNPLMSADTVVVDPSPKIYNRCVNNGDRTKIWSPRSTTPGALKVIGVRLRSPSKSVFRSSSEPK